jgi:F-type H+-transporting ATPase subunit b
MLIDWFTVGAQFLNFLILVWLLKRFLYKPVLDAIDAREQRIAGELAKAASKLTEAQREHDEFDRKNTAFDEERGALAAKAASRCAEEREALMQQAHQDADELRANSAVALAAERTLLGRQVTRLAQREVFAVARKALAELASANLEERMGEVFTRRLRVMDARAKALLAAALHDSREPALLRSSFELPAAERATIQNALNEAFAAEVRVRFVTAPEAVCGIELTANGQKLAWSIAEYLKTLEEKLDVLLRAENAPAPDKPVTAASARAAPAQTAPARVAPAPAAPARVASALPSPAAVASASPSPAAVASASPSPAAVASASPSPAAVASASPSPAAVASAPPSPAAVASAPPSPAAVASAPTSPAAVASAPTSPPPVAPVPTAPAAVTPVALAS